MNTRIVLLCLSLSVIGCASTIARLRYHEGENLESTVPLYLIKDLKKSWGRDEHLACTTEHVDKTKSTVQEIPVGSKFVLKKFEIESTSGWNTGRTEGYHAELYFKSEDGSEHSLGVWRDLINGYAHQGCDITLESSFR